MSQKPIIPENLTSQASAFSRALARFQAKKQEMGQPARIGFLIDATGSRRSTWEEAQSIQNRLFRQVAGNRRIELRLVHFGGNELSDHGWKRDPLSIAMTMTAVRCQRGLTQILPGLERFLMEGDGRSADAVILVGDCFEEEIGDARLTAAKLKAAGIKVYSLLEGDDWVANEAFRCLAEATGGTFAKFGETLPLGDLCEGIALLTAGGRKALARLPNKTVQRLLLPPPNKR